MNIKSTRTFNFNGQLTLYFPIWHLAQSSQTWKGTPHCCRVKVNLTANKCTSFEHKQSCAGFWYSHNGLQHTLQDSATKLVACKPTGKSVQTYSQPIERYSNRECMWMYYLIHLCSPCWKECGGCSKSRNGQNSYWEHLEGASRLCKMPAMHSPQQSPDQDLSKALKICFLERTWATWCHMDL